MSKKGKGLILDSAPSYGKARQRHDFMQDYEELRMEADVMRRKLQAAKRKKLLLAAEVGFLRRKYKHLIKTKNTSTSREHCATPLEQIDRPKEQISSRKDRRLPVLVSHKKQFTGKQVSMLNTSPVTVLAQRKSAKEATGYNSILSSDSNRKSRMLTPKEALATANLNRYNTPSREEPEPSLPTRAPLFDLNEVSTGDEEWVQNVEAANFEEANRSSVRGMGDEQQNDLNISVCRNAGEGSSRSVGKRKISWLDSVALRV